MKNTDFLEVEKALSKIQAKVDETQVSSIVPTTMKSEANEFINSGFYFQPHKNPIQIYKEGLTESETKFFTSVTNESRAFVIKNFKVGFLICVEAAQEAWRYFQENNKPDLLVWPAYWGKDEVPIWNETLTNDDLRVYLNNNLWRIPILRVAPFENHENIGLKPGPFGQSLVIDRNNQLYYAAAKSKAEDYVVMLQKNEQGLVDIVGVKSLL